jgi:tetratricopeptide (TPR) repeat protein
MSALLRGLKRYSDAEQLASQALAIAEDRLGPDHPQVALILDNLAAANSEQGRFSEAEPLYRRAIAIQQKSLAANHPDLASTLIDYAALLRKTGRKKQASNLETRARNIRSANPGDRQARLTIDVRELERPNSFLPAR